MKKDRALDLEQLRLKSITERSRILNERRRSASANQPIMTSPAAAAGSSSGGSGVSDNTANNYVVNDYVENYFE